MNRRTFETQVDLMIDWKLSQMIKASGWPSAPEAFLPGADFSAKTEGGWVPLHWACLHGKDGLLRHMLENGANVLDRTEEGQGLLELALKSGSFQTVMLLIDALKAVAAPSLTAVQQQALTQAFSKGHPNLKNRLQQTLKDWDRISRQALPSSRR